MDPGWFGSLDWGPIGLWLGIFRGFTAFVWFIPLVIPYFLYAELL